MGKKKKKTKTSQMTHEFYEIMRKAGKLFSGRLTPRGFRKKNKKKEHSKKACREKLLED